MVYSTKQMHSLAEAKAIEYGPRKIVINGELYMGYALTKSELFKLFVDNGYSANRTRWLHTVMAWGDTRLWGEIVPSEFPDTNNWSVKVIFTNLADAEKTTLLLEAEKQQAKTIPKLPREIFLCARSSRSCVNPRGNVYRRQN